MDYNKEPIPSVIHKSWYPFVESLFQTKELKELKYSIIHPDTTYPKRQDIFNVFMMSLYDIKVVVLGQDPYSNGSANGYAFAVDKDRKIPFSLNTIFRELTRENVGYCSDRTLFTWISQYVFLLNTALTVEKDRPNSHKELWRNFTSNIIGIIASEVNPVWMLWGGNAKDYEILIRTTEKVPSLILKAAHPAAEAAGRGGGFLGCNHFNLCNEYLKEKGLTEINW